MAAELEDRDGIQEVENSLCHSDSALSIDDIADEDQPVALDCSWSNSSGDSFTYLSGMVEPRNRIYDMIVERLNCEVWLIKIPAKPLRQQWLFSFVRAWNLFRLLATSPRMSTNQETLSHPWRKS